MTAVRGSSRGPSARLTLLAVVGALVAAVAVAVASAPSPAPSPVALLSAAPSLSAAPTAPAPPPGPLTERTVVVLRDVSDPEGALASLTSCASTVRTTGHAPPVVGATVDSVAEAVGRDAGWLFVPPGVQASTRVWLGDDVVALAEAVGEPMVAVGPSGEVWLGGPAGATRWLPVATPQGRTAWVMTADQVVGAGRCRPWAMPPSVAGLRSLTCAGLVATSCVDLLPIAEAADVVTPGGDLVVVVPACIDSHRCYATPLTLVGLPPSWPAGFVRAAETDPATGRMSAVPLAALPAEAIDALSRPSLPLPTRIAAAEGSACSDTLAGQLHMAPWDPRVAWVGDTRVVWPVGTTLRFLPHAQLAAPGDPFGVYAASGDAVTLTGKRDGAGHAFDACRLALAPAPSASAPPASKGTGETPALSPGPLTGRGTGG